MKYSAHVERASFAILFKLVEMGKRTIWTFHSGVALFGPPGVVGIVMQTAVLVAPLEI